MKKCPYCASEIDKIAILCPICHTFLGNFLQHVVFFLKTQSVVFVLVTLVTALVTGVSTFYFTKYLPERIIEVNPKPALSKERANLVYAAGVEKIGYWSILGIRIGDCYRVNVAVSNHGAYKLSNIKLHILFSSIIVGHQLPREFEIMDDSRKIQNLQTHFRGKNEAIIITPTLLPEQNFFTSFYFKGAVKIIQIAVSSSDAVGIQTEFSKK